MTPSHVGTFFAVACGFGGCAYIAAGLWNWFRNGTPKPDPKGEVEENEACVLTNETEDR